MTSLALALIGASLFAALNLALGPFRATSYPGSAQSRAMGLLLLALLAGLQLTHFAWLAHGLPWVSTGWYRSALFAVAPAFYGMSRPLLSAPSAPRHRVFGLMHAAPVLLGPLVPEAWGLPAAFLIGSGYLVWLACRIVALRRERSRFQVELALLGAAFLVAVAASVLGLLRNAWPENLFFSLYAMAIGGAFVLVQLTLVLRPQLPVVVSETVQASYQNTTLTHVDCNAALARLDHAMTSERLYRDAQLSLSGLAQAVGLSPHQLSELLNARLGKGFARYLREQRVAEARHILCAEPRASVLSVGLSVGFSSQSGFYEAFRELEGMTPGQYRKLHGPPVDAN